MEDLQQQSETASLPKRLSLKHKARAGDIQQALLPPSLFHLQSGGEMQGRAAWGSRCTAVLRFHTFPLPALRCFHFHSRKQNKANTAQPPETHPRISHAPGITESRNGWGWKGP